MKILVEGDLIIINSRYNLFWFELVLIVNGSRLGEVVDFEKPSLKFITNVK